MRFVAIIVAPTMPAPYKSRCVKLPASGRVTGDDGCIYVRWKALRDFVRDVIGEADFEAERDLIGRSGEL